MPVYHRAKRALYRGDGALVLATERPLDPRVPRTASVFIDDEAGAILRAAHGAFVSQARARKFWYPYADQLVAAWVVEAYTSDPSSTLGDLVRTVISADGRVIARDSLVADAAFSYNVYAESFGEKHPFDSPLVDSTPHPTGVPDGTLPGYVSQQLVTVDGLNMLGDPWLPAGAVETNGNNVDAYADLAAPTGLGDGDFRAMASGNAFNYAYNTAQGPLASTTQQMAAITSLFYVVSWLHDFWYDAGFTEVAGNAQAFNYDRGGVEGDPLLAEAQDSALAGSRNNANMATPEDGMSPRMQVYLWNGKDARTMSLAPSGRMPINGGSSFGPKDFTVTGSVVLGQDGAGVNPTDGCTPFTNTLTGVLVLVDRGNCTYKTKTTNAQAAGALGIIIANNVASSTPPTLGDDPTLAEPTIPSVSITMEEGAAIKADLGAGAVSATLQRTVAPELDGSLDSTLIAHEFGHYVHHRLSICNNGMCRAMSEGWGDFSALLLLARPGDDLHGAFPFSVYSTQGNAGDPKYFGIRRAPYSVNFAINAMMFRHMASGEPLPTHPLQPANSNAEIHNAGEIWAAALWEVYVALQQARAPSESFLDVRAKMARYVVSGLSLVPEEASPLETRDGILAAALAESPADHALMIQAFARRGFGSCAVAPPPSSIDFLGITESTIVAGNPQIATMAVEDGCDDDGVIDTGETATLKLHVINQGHAPLTDVTLAVTSELPGVTVLTPPMQLARLDSFATTDLEVAVALDPGVTEALAADLVLRVTSTGGCEDLVNIPLAARFNIDDVKASSATDTFDAFQSYWEPWVIAWHHVRLTALDGIWHGDDLSLTSDTRLTSPRLVGDATTPLTITFLHRYQFEATTTANWDGGVLEYSVDDGATWMDISDLAVPGYTGVLSKDSGNELGDRMAYTGTNAAWPEYDTVTLDLGTALADQAFRFRFRIGTDGGTGAAGWDIDDVAFAGIVGTPFPSQVADDGVCTPPADDPVIAGGGGCCETSGGGSPASGLLVFGVLGLLVRRRRTARTATTRSRR